MENYEMIIMEIIVQSGSTRSCAMEAIAHAKEKNYELAHQSLEQAGEELSKAHHIQTDLIQKEAAGEHVTMSLLMVHAQDHLMTSALALDLAKEFVELYEKIGG